VDSLIPPGTKTAGHVKTIELGLSRGRNAMAIRQDLVDQYGFASSYQSVQRFVRNLRSTQSPEARVVITTPPARKRKWIMAQLYGARS
jgi:hypothetical protein